MHGFFHRASSPVALWASQQDDTPPAMREPCPPILLQMKATMKTTTTTTTTGQWQSLPLTCFTDTRAQTISHSSTYRRGPALNPSSVAKRHARRGTWVGSAASDYSDPYLGRSVAPKRAFRPLSHCPRHKHPLLPLHQHSSASYSGSAGCHLPTPPTRLNGCEASRTAKLPVGPEHRLRHL